MTKLLPFLLCAPALFAQPISLGLKIGAPFNEAFDTLAQPRELFESETRRYILGPTLEVHLPLRFSIEVDALYTKWNFSSASAVADSVTTATASVNSWEVPLMLKYRFSGGLLRPFVDTGVAFNTLSGVGELRDFFRSSGLSNQPGVDPSEAVRSGVRRGFVLGGGLEVRVPFLRISPEIRWTRWGWNYIRDIQGLVDSRDDEVKFLLGVTF